MPNGPTEDVFPIENMDFCFSLLCMFTGLLTTQALKPQIKCLGCTDVPGNILSAKIQTKASHLSPNTTCFEDIMLPKCPSQKAQHPPIHQIYPNYSDFSQKKQTQHLKTCHPKWRGVFQPSFFRCPYVFFSCCEGTLLEYLESCPFLASPSFFVLHLARPPKQVCHWAATAQSLRRPTAHGNCCNSQRVRGTFFP